MSLKPLPIGPVPQETARLAKAVFPEGSTFMKMRDELGTLYQDEMFAALFPKDGQPALAPWRLALVTIMQFTRADYLIVKQLMPCALVWIGSMPLGSS
jgi:transposase